MYLDICGWGDSAGPLRGYKLIKSHTRSCGLTGRTTTCALQAYKMEWMMQGWDYWLQGAQQAF